MDKIKEFQELADLFKVHGYHLYLVGGTVRDYLLGLELSDMDAVTDATPIQVVQFLPNCDTTFAHLGSLKYKTPSGLKFDITTLREESNYLDSRHPSQIIFVKDLALDYKRRDFTINAMYMDDNLNVIDYCHGQDDLRKHILRMVGDPDKRLKEDPLRILRAIRFHLVFKMILDEKLEEAMRDRFYLLNNITDAKIQMELDKINEHDVDLRMKRDIFAQFDIDNLKGVIK